MKSLLPLSILLLAACSSEPPDIVMATDEGHRTGELGSNYWTSLTGSAHSSYGPPNETVSNLDMGAFPVEAASSVRVAVVDGSTPELEAEAWDEHGPLYELDTTRNEVQMPEEPGLYPIGITADWPDSSNHAVYTLYVEVK
ncbi:hypothetical protein [Alkalicoccus chagannorensis]|uniref:hypothetical protein n=1 Tax=Alkalicoccus chagannorensis TaxID=427072 RepID=UPI00047A0C93|nr:hypothetical protein [Alkalicoccus chagannorensis]